MKHTGFLVDKSQGFTSSAVHSMFQLHISRILYVMIPMFATVIVN
jgi:hypothetical protein